ncbi:MAG: hypothetical protein KIT25_11155 [Enhydrobacter sp.]|nr:MAG: hypothetical protein KIT25_11155 [Enhydrobacter sp.]
MVRIAVIAAVLASLSAWPAVAVEPTDVKGLWTGQTPDCGAVNLQINSQRKGALEGTFQCTKTGVTTKFGLRMVLGQQMAGSFDGTTLVLDGEKSTVRLNLDGNKLVGYTAGVGQPKVPMTLTRK